MKTLPLSARQTEPAEGSRKRKVTRSILEMLFLAILAPAIAVTGL